MNQPYRSVTGPQLRALALEHGYQTSASQLARWHRAGLLPRPQQRSLGKGRGTISIYPPGTGKQLLDLCALHLKQHSLTLLGWQLWWMGYDIHLSHIKQVLSIVQMNLLEKLQELRLLFRRQYSSEAFLEGLEVDFVEQIEMMAKRRFKSKPLRRIRKRTGLDNFPTFLRLLLEGTLESEEISQSYNDPKEILIEQRILAKGLGLTQWHLQVLFGSEQQLYAKLYTTVQYLSQTLPGLNIEHVTEKELIVARYHSYVFLSHPLWQSKTLTFPTLEEITENLTYVDQTYFVLFWLIQQLYEDSHPEYPLWNSI